ncbi:MAG TPA: zinc ribbon domain-containing protein, partial [Solirubrobacterales bacterium]
MSDACPNCGATLAPDQRYCLACGQRRGDPRLPFMDAVAFMEASKRPQPAEAAPAETPPPSHRPPISANASLVAGVATLVLAIGVGVMIGRSGDNGSNTASAAPQIIRVGGGAETASTAKSDEGSAAIGGGGGKSKSATKAKAKAKAATGSSGASKATEEVFEPAPGVKIA